VIGQVDGGTAKLFYEFSLEDVVPQDQLLRRFTACQKGADSPFYNSFRIGA